MAIKQTTRFETTDGTLYTNEKEAQRAQETLNNKDRKSFRLKTWGDFVNFQLTKGTEEIQKIYGNLTRGNYGVTQSQDVFDRLWLGTIRDLKLNQRRDYSILLTTIIGSDETHIKADGVYDFTVDGGAKTLMTRSKEAPYNLSATSGLETYILQASPGGFTLSNGKGIIGTSSFVDNQWSLKSPAGTFSVTWEAGK